MLQRRRRSSLPATLAQPARGGKAASAKMLGLFVKIHRAASSDPAGCTALTAPLNSVSCSGLRCDCGELILFPTLVPRSTLRDTIPLKTNAFHRTRVSQIQQANHRCSSNRSHGCPHTTRLLTRPACYSRTRTPVSRLIACLFDLALLRTS